jgi:hypothetical protein
MRKEKRGGKRDREESAHNRLKCPRHGFSQSGVCHCTEKEPRFTTLLSVPPRSSSSDMGEPVNSARLYLTTCPCTRPIHPAPQAAQRCIPEKTKANVQRLSLVHCIHYLQKKRRYSHRHMYAMQWLIVMQFPSPVPFFLCTFSMQITIKKTRFAYLCIH